jgi:hypothetical protein
MSSNDRNRSGNQAANPSGGQSGVSQESGASGGPPPTTDELAGRSAGVGTGRPPQSGARASGAGRPDDDNASQHQVQGSADADADHETGDQSQGSDKRMD